MSTCVFRYAKLVEAMEEKCLKKSRHFPAKDAIYETPSDYDPLALNMGQLVVHRISLRSNQIFGHKPVMSNLMHSECCLCTTGTQNQNGLLRCKCDPNQLQYGERCGKVLPFKHQVGRIPNAVTLDNAPILRGRLCKAVVFRLNI